MTPFSQTETPGQANPTGDVVRVVREAVGLRNELIVDDDALRTLSMVTDMTLLRERTLVESMGNPLTEPLTIGWIERKAPRPSDAGNSTLPGKEDDPIVTSDDPPVICHPPKLAVG